MHGARPGGRRSRPRHSSLAFLSPLLLAAAASTSVAGEAWAAVPLPPTPVVVVVVPAATPGVVRGRADADGSSFRRGLERMARRDPPPKTPPPTPPPGCASSAGMAPSRIPADDGTARFGDDLATTPSARPPHSTKVGHRRGRPRDELDGDLTVAVNHSSPPPHSGAMGDCALSAPRGGGGGDSEESKSSGDDETGTTGPSSAPAEVWQPSSPEHESNNFIDRWETKLTSESQSRRKDKMKMLTTATASPRRLLRAVRGLIGRAAGAMPGTERRLTSSSSLSSDSDDSGGEAAPDLVFDELDRIFDGNYNHTVGDYAEGEREIVGRRPPPADGGGGGWLETPLPRAVKATSPSRGRWERSLRSWMKKMELKFIGKDTARALTTIRGILEAFPDYGFVDLLGMYSPKDVIWSIVALSRLQRVLESEYSNGDDDSKDGNGRTDKRNEKDDIDDDVVTDKELLEDLAHYCSFANAAYGWKGFAFCGRLHLGGNNRVLIKRTGIDGRDIVATNWHSRANRPAYYIARDVERKSIVLGIRGTISPRDVLTDLCASAENFMVEDDPQIVVGPSLHPPPPLIVGRAHGGMIAAAKAVARLAGGTVSYELDTRPDFSLVIVGHSLGGGVGAVLAAMWMRRYPGRVRSIGYGSPCVFPPNNNGTRAFGSVCVSVTGEGDPFATISLGHLADTTKALSSLCRDRGLRDEILKQTGAGLKARPKDMTRENYDWCASAMAALRSQMDSEKLLPPGTIYHMSGPLIDLKKEGHGSDRLGRDAAVLKSIDATTFNELKLHARMFDVSLHVPVRYEIILARIAAAAR